MVEAKGQKDVTDLLKHWFDALGHGRGGRGADGAGQEVGDASDDADIDVGLHLGQGLGEDADVTTRQNMGILQTWMSTATCLVDVGADVRIPEQREAS